MFLSAELNLFQLNLVFRRPSGRRWPLVSSQNEDAMRSDAEKLAEFLNVPLLDDTDSPWPQPGV